MEGVDTALENCRVIISIPRIPTSLGKTGVVIPSLHHSLSLSITHSLTHTLHHSLSHSLSLSLFSTPPSSLICFHLPACLPSFLPLPSLLRPRLLLLSPLLWLTSYMELGVSLVFHHRLVSLVPVVESPPLVPFTVMIHSGWRWRSQGTEAPQQDLIFSTRS